MQANELGSSELPRPPSAGRAEHQPSPVLPCRGFHESPWGAQGARLAGPWALGAAPVPRGWGGVSAGLAVEATPTQRPWTLGLLSELSGGAPGSYLNSPQEGGTLLRSLVGGGHSSRSPHLPGPMLSVASPDWLNVRKCPCLAPHESAQEMRATAEAGGAVETHLGSPLRGCHLHPGNGSSSWIPAKNVLH